MSFFEDNYDGYEPPESTPEDNWENGIHETADGKIIKLKDMSESHLKNTIRYFKQKGFDVSILEKTLQKKLKLK